jgi:hypothetical protein
MVTAPLAGIDEFGIMADIVEDLGIEVKIINDDLSLLQTAQAFHRKQADVSRACADKINNPFFCGHRKLF